MSAFDKLYRSAIPMKFFTKGWGKPETLIKLIEHINIVSQRSKFETVLTGNTSINIEKRTEHKNVVLLEGSFVSPFVKALPDIMEQENAIARFQMVLPKEWNSPYKPVCMHLAGTGDHTYSRRRFFLANRLIADGIGSIIIMNPFYWLRKPKDQKGSSLNYVSDLFVMGGALIMECNALLKWCESNGYGPLALHGISMGGYMASLCATVWPKPISLIPCLSWSTASVVFVDGILGTAVDWNTLSKQYYADSVYSNRVRQLIQPPVPDRYNCHIPSVSNQNSSPQETMTQNPLTSVPAIADLANNQSLSFASHVSSSESTSRYPAQSTPFHAVDSISTSGPNCHDSAHPRIELIREGAPETATSNFLKTALVLSLTPLKQFQLNGSWTSWNIPETLRRPLDASLWHSGVSMLRSWPDSLGVISNPPDPEVSDFLRELMDYFTHLGNFNPIVEPKLLLSVTAEQDAYIPRHGVIPLDELYPGSEIRILPQSGHVGAYLRNAVWTKDFQQAITDCLNRQIELCYGEPGPFGSKPSTSRTALRRKH